MSIIDALETENKQALGALELVTGQRDRLREALRITAIIADMRGKRLSPSCPPVLDEEGQHELGLLPGDLDGEA